MENIFYSPLGGSLHVFGEKNVGLTFVDKLPKPETVFI